MKNILCTFLLLLFILTSCNSVYISNGSAEIDNSAETSDNLTTAPGETSPVSGETTTRIKIEFYPNPRTVSAYSTLNEDQKMAYDAIGDALCKALDGSFSVGETYNLERRISWYDFMLAYKIIAGNYTALEEILTNFFSRDSLGTQEYTDGIFFFDDSFVNGFVNEGYPELCKAADGILNDLTYDGTESGKAFAIAKWFVDNVISPSDYKDRSSDSWLVSAAGPILKKEAVCDGYSKAYDFLCKKAGLETIYVTSFEQMHAWNMICIDNAWYHIDTTWMSSKDYREFFMMCDKECYMEHGEAEYYYIPGTLENIIPEATHCSSYGCLSFDTADGAFDYLSKNKPPDRTKFYFSSADEKNKFMTYDKRYIRFSDSYLSVSPFCENILSVSYK